MIFRFVTGFGIFCNIVSMTMFAKYCGLLKNRWALEEETAARYQARAQRWLAASVCFIVVAMASMFLGAALR